VQNKPKFPHFQPKIKNCRKKQTQFDWLPASHPQRSEGFQNVQNKPKIPFFQPKIEGRKSQIRKTNPKYPRIGVIGEILSSSKAKDCGFYSFLGLVLG
jgi:hypothetical protein